MAVGVGAGIAVGVESAETTGTDVVGGGNVAIGAGVITGGSVGNPCTAGGRVDPG